MSEPLPCPFCGEAPDVDSEVVQSWDADNGRVRAIVRCENVACYIQPRINDYMPLDEAIKRWNMRAPKPESAT